MTTTVRSDLARTEQHDTESDRCTSTTVVQQTMGDIVKGETLRCTRPASKHRVHEAKGWVQW